MKMPLSIFFALVLILPIAACAFGGHPVQIMHTPTTEVAVITTTSPVTKFPKTETSKHKVIIDTDMAPDDWMAVLYLLLRQDVEVLAIIVTGAGEAHCIPGVGIATGLVALPWQTSIPVACGRETPLRGDRVFPKSWRDYSDSKVVP